jgi:hypothetical protein
MAMPAHPTEWTVKMVRALPDDGNRYEVIDGELFVTPAPSWTHQTAVLELAMILAPYVREHAIGHVIVAPADVVFGPRNMVEPDLLVVPLVSRGSAQLGGGWEAFARSGGPFTIHHPDRPWREARPLPTQGRPRVLNRRRGRARDRTVSARRCSA